jgi:hypothetical protein
MSRKKLIEDNLTLLRSNDLETKDLVLNLLFPDTFNLTVKFEHIDDHEILSIIDISTGITIFCNKMLDRSDYFNGIRSINYVAYTLLGFFNFNLKLKLNFLKSIVNENYDKSLYQETISYFSFDILGKLNSTENNIYNTHIVYLNESNI